MRAEKFELFMCCLGNGTTVCNKAVMEHGDYKTIAHISSWGKIRLFVPDDYIPSEAMERIRKVAEADRQKYLKWWNTLPTITRYEKVLDALPLGMYQGIVKNKEWSMEEKIKEAEKFLVEVKK